MRTGTGTERIWVHADRAFALADQAFAEADKAFEAAEQVFEEVPTSGNNKPKPDHNVRFTAKGYADRWRLMKKFLAWAGPCSSREKRN